MSTVLHVTFSPRFVAPSTVGLKQENLQLPHVNSTSTAGLAPILPLPLHTITACSLSPLPELRGRRERSDVVTAVSDISFGPGAVAAAEGRALRGGFSSARGKLNTHCDAMRQWRLRRRLRPNQSRRTLGVDAVPVETRGLVVAGAGCDAAQQTHAFRS